MYLKIAGWVVDSVDPDQMLHSAPFDQSVHCLFRHVCLNTKGKYSTDLSDIILAGTWENVPHHENMPV